MSSVFLSECSYNGRSTYSTDEPLYGAHIRVLSHYHNNYSTLRGKERPCSLHTTDLSHLPPYPLRSDADAGPPPDVQHLAISGAPASVPTPPPPPPTDTMTSQMSRTADHVRMSDGLELIAVNGEVMTCGGATTDGEEVCCPHEASAAAAGHPYTHHYPVYSFRMSTSRERGSAEGENLEPNFQKCRTLVCALNNETQQPICFCRSPAHPPL